MTLKLIDINELTIPIRQRKLFSVARINELAISIAAKGLFHPIVCIEIPNEEPSLVSDVPLLKLVAGERRARAIKKLHFDKVRFSCDGAWIPSGQIPYILVTDLDEIALREAELDENIQREDLTWQEKVTALDELHSLRLARNPTHKVIDTAREIAKDKITVNAAEHKIQKARVIAEHLEDAEVANAKDETQAFNIVSRKLEQEMQVELIKRQGPRKSRHLLLQADFCEIAQNTEACKDVFHKFDCIIADPPYGISSNAFGDISRIAHTYDDSVHTTLKFLDDILRIGMQVTCPDAHIYIFCDVEHFLAIRDVALTYKWVPWRTPLIWHKTSTSSHAPLHNRGFRRSYEMIMFATKGSKPFAQVYSDVMEFSSPRPKSVAAQKPVALYKTLISRSVLPGGKVLDPCCGSGTIFPAADDCGVIAVGVEKNEVSYKVAKLTLDLLSAPSEEDK